jgi:hypothetical protein
MFHGFSWNIHGARNKHRRYTRIKDTSTLSYSENVWRISWKDSSRAESL